jgi:hypothetical protein
MQTIRTSVFREIRLLNTRLVPAERPGEAAAEERVAEMLLVLRRRRMSIIYLRSSPKEALRTGD